MIFVGIDDTDVPGSPGTKRLARELSGLLAPRYRSLLVVRHQLLFDPRIPYTSKNSSASILLQTADDEPLSDLAATIRVILEGWFVTGSDPGLCVTAHVPGEVTEFGRRCQQEVVRQEEALALARRHGIDLQSLGGSGGGVIGALAAVGLAAGRNDGRIVGLGQKPDDLSGEQEIALLYSYGVDQVRRIESDEVIAEGRVDVGKRLRPNYRDGMVVLFVEPANEACGPAPWRAVRRN